MDQPVQRDPRIRRVGPYTVTNGHPMPGSQLAWLWECDECPHGKGWTIEEISAHFYAVEHILLDHMPITWFSGIDNLVRYSKILVAFSLLPSE